MTREPTSSRALAALGAFWGLAVAAVFLPVLHFVLVPSSLATGVVVAGGGQAARRPAKGLLPGQLDPRYLLLSMMGLTAFPLAFPHITRLVTGRRPRDPAFRKQQVAFLRSFAAWLKPGRGPGRLAGRARRGGRR